jgi:hypothetical protein
VTTPKFSVTTDDARYYEWPKNPGIHIPSITTVIKHGVPKPVLQTWAIKKTAQLALSKLDMLKGLLSRADS